MLWLGAISETSVSQQIEKLSGILSSQSPCQSAFLGRCSAHLEPQDVVGARVKCISRLLIFQKRRKGGRKGHYVASLVML